MVGSACVLTLVKLGESSPRGRFVEGVEKQVQIPATMGNCDDQVKCSVTVSQGQFLETLSMCFPHHQFKRFFVMDLMILSE